MDLRKALGLSVALLVMPRSPSIAADLEENYGYADASQEVPATPSKIEFGTGWYVRGDLGATMLPNVTPTLPALGSAPELKIQQTSKLGYTADLGAGYQILPNVRTDITFDFKEPIKVVTSNYGNNCPQSYQQGVQIGSTVSTSSTSSTVATGTNSSMTTGKGTVTSSTQTGTTGSTSITSTGPDSVTTTNPSTGEPLSTTYGSIYTFPSSNNGTNSSTSDLNTQTNVTDTTVTNNGNGTTTTSSITTTSTPKYQYDLIKGACSGQYAASIRRYDVMVNAYYDITTWHGITPYVGAGVGLSFGHYASSSNFYNSDGSTYGATITDPATGLATIYSFHQTKSGEFYNFAFAVMAGIAFDILPHTKIDLGYRYLNEGRVLGVNLNEHQARAGLRYMIDN